MKRRAAKGVERLPVFSFLAVLVCFMGCLLALLILVGARAQSKATDIGQAPAAPEADPAQQQKLAEINGYIGKLQAMRTALTERLTKDRMTLSHLEDHTRRLRDQIEQQRMEVQQMRKAGKARDQDNASLVAEANRVEGLVKDSAKLLDETKQQASKKTSYSVIPYEGRHATQRRPIYLECRADAVIVQPEGITLREDDFEESLGPDSPLATAIRAASEHVAHDHAGGKVEQAYPLLIVRASGIRAYYAARAMLTTWSDDFGYELVDDNWDLKFPPPDPKMAQVLESAVTVARRRMQFHASTQRSAGASGENSFSGSGARRGTAAGDDSGGGGLAENGGGGSGGNGNFGGPGLGSGGQGGGRGVGGTHGPGSGSGQGVPRLAGLNGGAGAGGAGPGGTALGGTSSAAAARAGGFRPGNSTVGTPGNPISGGNGNGAGYGNGGGAPGQAGGGLWQPGVAGGGAQGGSNGGAPGGGTPGGAMAGGGTPGGAGVASGAGGAGGPTYPGGILDPNAAAPLSSTGSGGPGGAMPLGMTAVPAAGMGGDPYSRPKPKDLKSDKQSLAETRGQNWALPGASQGAVGVTRPLRIDVAADRILIEPGESGSAKREILCTGPTEEAVEQFVSTMWEQMRGWGIAGRGMYWRPVLNLHVLPGGHQRAAELKDLLSGSGLDVKVQP